MKFLKSFVLSAAAVAFAATSAFGELTEYRLMGGGSMNTIRPLAVRSVFAFNPCAQIGISETVELYEIYDSSYVRPYDEIGESEAYKKESRPVSFVTTNEFGHLEHLSSPTRTYFCKGEELKLNWGIDYRMWDGNIQWNKDSGNDINGYTAHGFFMTNSILSGTEYTFRSFTDPDTYSLKISLFVTNSHPERPICYQILPRIYNSEKSQWDYLDYGTVTNTYGINERVENVINGSIFTELVAPVPESATSYLGVQFGSPKIASTKEYKVTKKYRMFNSTTTNNVLSLAVGTQTYAITNDVNIAIPAQIKVGTKSVDNQTQVGIIVE